MWKESDNEVIFINNHNDVLVSQYEVVAHIFAL